MASPTAADSLRADDGDTFGLLENLVAEQQPDQRVSRRGAIGVALLIVGVVGVDAVMPSGGRPQEQAPVGAGWAHGLQGKEEVEEAPWKCHRYEDDQDDAWCQSVGTFDGYDFLWVGEEAKICDECWCCKRPSVSHNVSSSPPPTTSTEAETPSPTPAPTPAPTPPPTQSPEQKALEKKVDKARVEAEGLRAKADGFLDQAKQQGDVLRANAEKYALKLLTKAQEKSNELMDKAEDVEEVAMKAVAATRVCVDLVGVELKGYEEVNLTGVVAPDVTTAGECSSWCQSHMDCGMSVFTSDGPSCKLFVFYTEEPLSWKESFNSSYCAPADAEKHLLASIDNVFKKKAWFPPFYDCAWAGESCQNSRCCANTCKGNKDFSACDLYTCYQKDEYFAGCSLGAAPEGWNGTALGGHPTQEVPKALEGQLVQGTSLFCFVVVVWGAGPTMPGSDGEGDVVHGWKDRGMHIMQCDEHAFIEGWPTGSVHNIDSFANAWEEVRKDGRWANHDWVVKVDADAVFFPERLKWHLDELRTPLGAPVYLRNTFYKFHFMGALEVLSKEALEIYYERSYQCDKQIGREGGEDYWLLQCLEGIGVNYQSDYDLLFDKYAAQNGCESDWAVAFHFYKSVKAWNECHDTSMNNWFKNHPQPEFVMKK